jgi:hypothetical protein
MKALGKASGKSGAYDRESLPKAPPAAHHSLLTSQVDVIVS